MNKQLVLLIVSIPVYIHASNRDVCTIISPHSQSVNAARSLLGLQELTMRYESQGRFGSFSVTPESTLTFRPERIAQCFFGDDIVKCKNTLPIQGSRVADRNKRSWLADYFGLPTDYNSRVRFDPQVSNMIVDCDLYLGSNTYIPGLYMRIHAPIVYSRWDLGFCETLVSTGSNSYDAGYVNPAGIAREGLPETFSSFIHGQQSPRGDDMIFHKLKYAKMDCSSQKITRLSDVQMVFGWNVLDTRRYHVGGGLRISIPTGNTYDACYLFEPIIGNGHHWEVGGHISAHIMAWEDEATEEHCGIYADVDITHLFKSQQRRSFDLCHNPNSRYMLAHKMGAPIEDNLSGIVAGVSTAPDAQYQKEISTIANLTTLDVTVSNNVQVDIAFMLNYTHGKNSWAFGYGFWGRSIDRIEPCSKIPFDVQSWAIKGDSHVFGFENNMDQAVVALSATQSKATIQSGKNFSSKGADTQALVAAGQKNPNIDNPIAARADANNDSMIVALRSQPGGSSTINTSIEPKLLTRKDVNFDSGRTRGHAHKIFSHCNHMLGGKRSIQPFIGFGTEVEFGQSSACTPKSWTCEKPTMNTALSFWGVWLKGGIGF